MGGATEQYAQFELRTRVHWGKRLGKIATAVAAVGLAATCVIPFVWLWPFVLVEHFRLQYVVAGVVVAAAAGALRLRGFFDVAIIATLVNALVIVPDLARPPRPVPADGTPIRVLLLNVHTSNKSYEAVRELITDVNADVIGILEVNQRWVDELAPAIKGYAAFTHPRDDNFGLAFYSRVPESWANVEPLGSPLPTMVGQVGGAKLLLVHALPPVNPSALGAQGDHLAVVADRARVYAPEPVVMFGDFNATPWSKPFRRVIDASGLCDTRAGFGYQGTFPASSVLMRIPIDHVLASCTIGVKARRVERDVGSDHLPIVIDLVLPKRGGAAR